MASEGKPIQGQCFCSAVKFEIAAGVEPAFQAYCHCHSCQCFHSAPFIAVVAFPIKLDHGFADKEGKLKFTEGADLVTSYNHSHNGGPRRTFCKRCGAAIANILEEAGIFVTFPRVIAKGGFTFKPQFHGNYSDKVFPFPDGLPKFSGFGKGDRLDEGSPPKEYAFN